VSAGDTDRKRLVVVGASLAGLRTVEAARKLGHAGPITLIGAEEHLPYDRPPLSKAFLEAGSPTEVSPFRSASHLTDELGVELILGSPAASLDPQNHTVQVGDRAVPYDRLVIATGATARTLPGTDGVDGVHCLRTVDDARAVRAALDGGARAVVVGAGFIGSEVASGARKRGLPVTIVESLDVPLARSVGAEAGSVCAALHRANGVELRTGVGVDRVEVKDGRAIGVVLSDGAVIPAELVVVGIGVVPATGWLLDSGIALHGRDDGVMCDDTLATNLPAVYAVGDVAHWPNALFDGQLMRLEHWTNAAEHGAAVAANALATGRGTAVISVPYFWSDWYGHRIQFVGVPQDAQVEVLADEPYLSLYRRGDRVVGALTIDRPTHIMKLRRLVAQRANWDEAVEFARSLPIAPTDITTKES
jgi:NADPH-dependent 2,4-dienoyl-CoA reductase/sulfur reductase-like enzyme